MKKDRFGNSIDLSVGYARGKILRGPGEEMLREAQGARLIRRRAARMGPDSIYAFTGSTVEFPLQPEDLPVHAQESIGPALFGPSLRKLILTHLGGRDNDEVGVFNRTSAGIIAVETALASKGEPILSLVPGATSHPSVKMGANLAGARLVETSSLQQFERELSASGGSLVVITGVTSELQIMPQEVFSESIRMTTKSGRIALVDDAYGARVRTVLYGQQPALQLGADLAITSNHKAGLNGPRAGVLAGRAAVVQRVVARAMELGLEARAPLALGVLRSLELYRPHHLGSEVAIGKELYSALAARLGTTRVLKTAIGPLIEVDDILSIAQERDRTASPATRVVPAEAASALGMLLLEFYGILTVNAQAMPGARVSLRLKPTSSELERAGGVDTVVKAVDDSLDRLAAVIHSPEKIQGLILGQPSQGSGSGC